MDIHVYGQIWMSPWGYTSNIPRHSDEHENMLSSIKEAIFKEQNIVYEVGQSATILCKLIISFQISFVTIHHN